MKNFIALLLGLFIGSSIAGQEVKEFSLKEAKSFALENNYDIKNAKTDVAIARKRVNETLAIGLPQINGSISNNNYINIPTTLLPDFITPTIFQVNKQYFGLTPVQDPGPTQFFPAQFGTKYNATASISASQLIFSGEYIIGVKAARTFLEKTRIEYLKNELDVEDAVARSYYFVLIAEENQRILKQNLESLRQLADQTRETYKLGFIEETEADQVDILVGRLEAQLLSLQNQTKIAYSSLKHSLGLQLQDSIRLTDDLDSQLKQLEYELLLQDPFDYNENIDFRILIKQKEIAMAQVSRARAAYLPSINAFFSAQTNAMRSDYNFFDKDEPWYPTTVWGFEMNIPIFSSGNRAAKLQQAKLQLKKINEIGNKLKSGLTIQVSTARNDFRNAYLIYKNKVDNLQLAETIYKKTEAKFREGMSSSIDLLQMNNQFLNAESEYINAILTLLDNKLTLEKLLATEGEE
ncbi:MAG: TolC family protein [Bacteroidales bacterium]|nr:TolC family protein [Bacteroidales bacterium]MCF8343150.1 TolC family protein [Bacteroidales bacterium]MCF8350356.1 TolC family protein [Bacteroidales bacterium]MCF8376488.1 TolC family protein [Bacteroidales bacterium]MCF8401490.1 TolC family protein [Bacteroidales bacterium]